MSIILEYWHIILFILAILLMSILVISRYLKLSTEEQLEKVREWLLWAVTEAERELGGGTGRLKLRQVYDLFIVRFPWLARIVSFSTFSELVDEALIDMRELISTNKAVLAHVEDTGK